MGLFGRGRRLEELPRGAALVPLPAAQAQARQPRLSGAGGRRGRGGHRQREALDALRTGTAAKVKVKVTNDKKVKPGLPLKRGGDE